MVVSDGAMGETVRHIEEVVNQRRTLIREKDLDAMMAVYSEHYRYQDLTKADIRNIWKSFFEHYDRIHSLHSVFSHHGDARDPSHGRHHLHRGSVCNSGPDRSTGEPVHLGWGYPSPEL